jgi:hypothetical protein
LITAIKALNLDGLSAGTTLRHMALLRYDAEDPNQSTSVVILQKSPLTDQQVGTLLQAGQAFGMQPLFLPGVFETLFRGLNTDEITLDHFLVQKDYNLFPTTDDSPFFFNLDPGLPLPLRTLLIIAASILAIYLLFMAGTRSRPSLWQLLFFGGLGLGFILIEVPLIQRTLLLVGNPTLSMVIVLAALLISGGLGSLFSARWEFESLWKRVAIAAFVVAALAAILALGQPALVEEVSKQSFTTRVLITVLLLFPLGFVMGIPFANGLRLVGREQEATVPYLWGWNAVTSVAGSALAAGLALWFSFSAGMLAGAACYLIVALAAFVQFRRG